MVLVHLSEIPFRTHPHDNFHKKTKRAHPTAKYLSKNNTGDGSCQQHVPQTDLIVRNYNINCRANQGLDDSSSVDDRFKHVVKFYECKYINN